MGATFKPLHKAARMLVGDTQTPYAFGMALPARGVGLSARILAFAVLYAFLVKTVLVLAAPLAPTGLHGQPAGAGPIAGMTPFAGLAPFKGMAPFEGMALCTASADGVVVEGGVPLPAHQHDTKCCLQHCQAQLAALAVLALVAVAAPQPRHTPIWRKASFRGDDRTAAAYRFYARGPPIAQSAVAVGTPAA